MAPPAAGETPPPPPPADAERSASTEESRWLAALSEPELDLLISLKMLAVKRAETAGLPHLADAFDLRTLRALGVVLLEDFKQRLSQETSLDATSLNRLALSRDPDADASISATSSDSEVFRRRSKDQAIKPRGVSRGSESRCKMGVMERLSKGTRKEEKRARGESGDHKWIAKIFPKLAI